MQLSERIAYVRESKGVKQYEVANALGVEPPNYSRLEKRGDKLSIEQLKAISAALGVSLNELLGLDTPVVDESKIKELEKRNEELEERIKDKQSIIDFHKSFFTEILEGLGSDIIGVHSSSKFGGTISPFYKLTNESPYCEIINSETVKRRIENYLAYKSFESNLVEAVHDSELFDLEYLLKLMGENDFILQHKEAISPTVSSKVEVDWDKMATEQEELYEQSQLQKKRNTD
jgi:transcriptional regulator with XRE-family HTH domain